MIWIPAFGENDAEKNENVTVTVSKAFGEMMGLQKFYNTLSFAFYIREMVKSDFTADINEGKHHV